MPDSTFCRFKSVFTHFIFIWSGILCQFMWMCNAVNFYNFFRSRGGIFDRTGQYKCLTYNKPIKQNDLKLSFRDNSLQGFRKRYIFLNTNKPQVQTSLGKFKQAWTSPGTPSNRKWRHREKLLEALAASIKRPAFLSTRHSRRLLLFEIYSSKHR
jgi:hypothetical protein